MLHLGQRLGDYEVVRLIGEGGMAIVYEVRHAVLGSRYALKVMRPHLLKIPEARERFLAEGRIQARIQHENLIDVVGVVTWEEVAGLVMELLDGPTLSERLAEVGPLPLPEAAAVMRGLLAGVQVVHEAGIVHRDLKPDNIKLQPARTGGAWRPVLFDFGIARISSAGEARIGHTRRLHTQAGDKMGTPGYMSPEQLRDTASIDQRADIFSLGCILYEVLSGRVALTGDINRTPPVPLSLVAPAAPPALVAIVERAMHPDAAARFPDVATMRHALEAALADPPPPPRRLPPRPPYLLLLAAMLAVAGGILWAVAALLWSESQQRQADAAARAAVDQAQQTRTSGEDDVRLLETARKSAQAAQDIRQTPAAMGALALTTLWAEGWDQPARSAAEAEVALLQADALTQAAAAGGTAEGLLARAMLVGSACTGLAVGDARRGALCAEAGPRYDAAVRALEGDARGWLRLEAVWSAARHQDRIAAAWWSIRQAAPARTAWQEVLTRCVQATPDLSTSPGRDAALARMCLTAAAGLGQYATYFGWSRWLHDHDEARGGLTPGSIAAIFRGAHPSCRDLAGRGTPWSPTPRSARQRFCQHVGLRALGCDARAQVILDRHLRTETDPLLGTLQGTPSPGGRSCYLEP